MRGSGGARKTKGGKNKRAGRSKVGLQGRLRRGRGEEEEGGHVYCAWEVDAAKSMEGERRRRNKRKEEGIFVSQGKRNLIERTATAYKTLIFNRRCSSHASNKFKRL